MEIKVLGTGCAKCKTTYQTIEKVISENNLEDVKLTKVEDIVGNTTIPALWPHLPLWWMEPLKSRDTSRPKKR